MTTSQALELSRNPTVPHEVRYLAAEVVALANSGLVPQALRGKPDDILLIVLTGRELGLPGPNVSLQNIYAINGSTTLAAKLCVGKALKSGIVEIWTEEFGEDKVTVAGCRVSSPNRITRVTWTMAMAKRAGLDGKPNWKSYPQSMLYARASKEVVKQLCPEVMLGLDDGRHFDEIVGAPVEVESDEVEIVDRARVANVAAMAARDAEVVVAEVVLLEAEWVGSWRSRVKDAGLGRDDSVQIMRAVSGGAVSDSGMLPAELRSEADRLLAELVAERVGAA